MKTKNNPPEITSLFLDIGGVLLTNGWDRHARKAAVEKFELDAREVEERHHLTYDTYEEGKLSLDEYLQRVVFYQPRSFLPEDFKAFMFSRSQPFDDMLALIRGLKAAQPLKIVAVSNEGRELNQYRIRTFGLDQIFDAFVSSSFVHFRKPDRDIYQIALDVSQSKPQEVAYLDDRRMFIEVANSLGIHGILHTDFESTRQKLRALGLHAA